MPVSWVVFRPRGQFEVIVMAVPKRKSSNARTGSRRAHHFKKPRQLEYCSKCSTAVPSHVVCPNCGHYMGRTVVEPEE
jgi:large subunit ribosomal protein L32